MGFYTNIFHLNILKTFTASIHHLICQQCQSHLVKGVCKVNPVTSLNILLLYYLKIVRVFICEETLTVCIMYYLYVTDSYGVIARDSVLIIEK